MLIREQQMSIFRTVIAGTFETQMVEHLTNFARTHAESIGETRLRQVVQLGIARAEGYGWTQQGPVEFYLELMVMLGADCDTDSQYPWIEEILKASQNQMLRADRLHSKTMQYHHAVFGPAFEYEIQAIRRLLAAEGDLVSSVTRSDHVDMVMLLQWAYPEKATFLGPETLQRLVDCGQELSSRNGLTEPLGVALFTALLFAFGHGCCTDPQYPWIAAAIKPTGGKVVERLQSIFRKYLEQAAIELQRS